MRVPENIFGIWSPDDNSYLEMLDDYTIRHLEIEYQDGESIGWWTADVFFYEPGYNLVIYIDSQQQGEVYEIVELTDQYLTWCPVDKIDIIDRDESIGHIIGNIIKKAQEGYKLDPGLFQTLKKIPKNQFLELLESLDIMYPWIQ